MNISDLLHKQISLIRPVNSVVLLIVLAIGLTIGALASTAAGLWWTRAGQDIIVAEMARAAERDKFRSAQIDLIHQQIPTLRTRLDQLEERMPVFIASSKVFNEHAMHLGALDGRSDEFNRRLVALQDALGRVCAALDGISAASARKYGCR